MTNIEKRIKLEDILGNKFYDYNFISSNYTPLLNSNITLTCTVTNVYGDIVTGKSIQLYQNGVAVDTAKTTNNNGVVTWTISCTTEGVQTFKVGYKEIEVFVDNKASANHTHNQYLTTHQDISGKVDKVTGKGLSTNDFTNTYKNSLDNLSTTISNAVGNLELAEVVTTLPTSNIKTNRLYLVANTQNETENKYDIYLRVNNNWEKIDSLEVDITNYLSKTEASNTYQLKGNYLTSLPTHNHNDTYYTKTETDGLLDDKADTNSLSTVATTGNYNDLSNKPSIPSKTSDLNNDSNFLTTHQDITGKEDKSNKVSSWSATTTDAHYPSEKLVKDSLDNKSDTGHTHSGYASSNHSHGNLLNDGAMGKSGVSNKNVVTNENGYLTTEDKPSIPSKTSDLTNDSGFLTTHQDISSKANISDLSTVATSGSYNDLSNKPSIPSDVSELTDTQNTPFTPKSHTHTKSQITDFPTIPSASNTTPSADTTNGSVGSSSNYAKADHTHPKSNIYAEANHNHNSQISFGTVDDTSTSTVFTATVDGLTSLTDGTTVMLKNGVVTSEEGFTINVNGLGAKPVYTNLASATQDTTIFNINYTMLFVYDSTRVDGGCWVCYRGYDSNTNTIGYQIRTNSTPYTATDKGYRYRLWLETDNNKYMPVNTSSSTNATANRSSAMNTREFWIGGNILYNGTNGTTNANATMSATTLWKQYTLALGYSFNNTGSALVMTFPAPVYMVAKPTSNGKARLNTPFYTQTLPSSEDGLIYIYLGHMYSATSLELALDHPVYEYKNGSIRLYTAEYSKSEIDTLLNGKSDSNHTHNQYLTSHQDISGKIDTAGTGLTKSNTTLNHSNSVTAKSSSDVRAFTYDAQGHITGSTEIDGGDILVDERDNPVSIAYAISQLNSSKASSTHTHGNLQNDGKVGTSNNVSKNVVTDSNGKITVEDKYSHPSTHSSSMITDSNTYSNIGNTTSTLDNILSNINTKLGSLGSVELIEVTSNKGTASASTMNKLYLVAESSSATNDNYEIFVTVRTGTSGNYSYAWEKVDTARIDLSNYLTTTNAQQTYVAKENGKGLFSGSYTDLTNKPSYTATVTSSTTDSVKIGSININGSNVDIYAKDTVYTHPNDLNTTKTSGLYKIALNSKGHVTSATSVEKSDITNLGIASTDLANGTTNGLSSNDYTTTEKNKLANLHTVATTGSYNDLKNKPTIPTQITVDDTVTQNSSNPVKSSGIWSALQLKQDDLTTIYTGTNYNGNIIFDDDSNWFYALNNRIYHDYNDTYSLHFLKSDETDVNFDDLAITDDIPTKTSDLTNDSNFLTSHQDISGKEDKTNKSSSIFTDTGSTTKYPTVKAVEDYAVQKTSPKNISELTTLLDNASTGDTITLTDNYIATNTFNYTLSKNITINGNGHTIDANNNLVYFQFASTKTLKIINCHFKNLKSTDVINGLIANPMSSSTIIFDNCIFDKGSVKKGFIYVKNGYLKMNNCLFKDILLNSSGQIIFISNSNCEIYNTYFEGNTITPIYIKNTSLKNNIIKDCVFNNNIVAVLNESAESYQNTILENNLFLQSGDTLTGCVNKNYLTTHQDISGKANTSDLGDVAFSNDYTDLDNKPSQNVFYGTCLTSSATQTKVVTVDNWSFTTGNILFVRFENSNTYDGVTYLQIGDTSKTIRITSNASTYPTNHWRSGEMVAFVYDGTYMVMVNEETATTSYYGVTKLSSSIDSTSQSLSATPKAVKTAYDLADTKQDELVSGTNIKTVNSQTLLGSGNLSVGDVNTTDLGSVAFSNDYTDLDNLPSIPSITQTITDGDTTNVPSADAVQNTIDALLDNIIFQLRS